MIILDSCLFIRSTAFEPDEVDPITSSASHLDITSSHKGGRHTVSPRECRALISQQLATVGGIFVPAQQADEVLAVIQSLRDKRQINVNNARLLACVSQFMVNASVGNRIPILPKDLDEQHAVLEAALSIAHSTAEGDTGLGRQDALRFIRKNEHALARTLPEPNKESLSKGRKPYVLTDWLLCRAARRHQTLVVSADRDFNFLGAAYQKVTGYAPARYIEYVPASCDVVEYKENIQAKAAQASAFHVPSAKTSKPDVHSESPAPPRAISDDLNTCCEFIRQGSERIVQPNVSQDI